MKAFTNRPSNECSFLNIQLAIDNAGIIVVETNFTCYLLLNAFNSVIHNVVFFEL